MNSSAIKRGLILIVFSLGVIACKNTPANPYYNPNEFTLLIAASNNGEVGPCG